MSERKKYIKMRAEVRNNVKTEENKNVGKL
jgi:hypothetical protein